MRFEGYFMEKISAQVIIHGWVQGVYFRAFTRDQAQSLGLAGWVRNRRDGSVEAYFEGEKEKVNQMVAWCRRGSPPSRVEQVDVTYGTFSGNFGSFQIRYN
jgi:acylphosphatase